MLADALRRMRDGASMAELEDQHRGRSLITKNDQLIYSELDPLTEAYLLTAGTVRLFVGESSTTRTTLLLAAPAVFGDRDLLAGCAVSQESARSVSKATLLCYETEQVLAAAPLLTGDLLLRYARAIRHASYLAQPIERRVLWLLFEHHRSNRRELPNYESLALMADSAPKSIGRAIRALQDAALLRLDAERGFELTPEALAELEASEHVHLVHRMV